MKVLMLNGSGHKDSTTAVALKEIEKILAENGIEVETIQIGNIEILDCMQCGACSRLGRCVKDDLVNAFTKKAEEADGFIFATPTYYAHASGRLMSFLDRAFYSNSKAFRFKPGAAVTVARRGGNTSAFDDINKYFTINQMPVVSSTYWNMVYGMVPEDVEKDEEGLQTMRNLARNMVWLLRSIEAGKKMGVPLPETERKYWTNFIRDDKE